MTKIYSDGSCYWKDKNGGFGVFIEKDNSFIQGSFSNTKVGRMELMGFIYSLQYIIENEVEEAEIICDAQYVTNLINLNWINEWADFHFSNKKNKDLLIIIGLLLNKIKDHKKDLSFKITWTKGHIGNEGNEKADKIAHQGRISLIKIEDTEQFTLETLPELELKSF